MWDPLNLWRSPCESGERRQHVIPQLVSLVVVNNVKLANYTGLKSTVTLDDTLSALEFWRKSENFKASYQHIRNVEVLHIYMERDEYFKAEDIYEVYWHDSTGLMKQTKSTVAHSPFSKMLCNIVTTVVNNVKLANNTGLKSTITLDDTLSALEFWRKSENFKASYQHIRNVEVLHIYMERDEYFKAEDIYWHDSTGLMKQTKSTVAHSPFSKMLCNIYPGLHDFFVDEFGVDDNPPLSCYLEFLRQLSTRSSPSPEAKTCLGSLFVTYGPRITKGVSHN
ncbi:hypothetical protein Tco_0019955 [Tanacetum coccineum]